MFPHFELQTKQILTGNILLIFCCAFYLAWWILAFKPTGAIKGMKSGWLLIPAVIFGVAAILQIVRGSSCRFGWMLMATSHHLMWMICFPGQVAFRINAIKYTAEKRFAFRLGRMV